MFTDESARVDADTEAYAAFFPRLGRVIDASGGYNP